MHNITYISQHFLDWALQGYLQILGGSIFWSIIFTVIGVYVYLKQQSVVVWAVAMLIIIAAFGNYLVGVEGWISLIHILIALSITGLFLIFFTKYRR
jgi:CHASE2 domain-containing sensor protein